MKVLIIGSRSIHDIDLLKYVPENTSLIITGGADGIDKLAEEYADKHHISKLILYPEYNLYKKAAPLKRNEAMINLADKILVFWDGHSKGTKYSIDYAKKLNKEIEIFYN